MPAVSSILFYTINILIVATYVVIGLLTLRPRGPSGRANLTRLQQGLGAIFFFLCAALHLDLALHAYLDEPILLDSDGVTFDIALITGGKLVVAVGFMATTWARQRDRRKRR